MYIFIQILFTLFLFSPVHAEETISQIDMDIDGTYTVYDVGIKYDPFYKRYSYNKKRNHVYELRGCCGFGIENRVLKVETQPFRKNLKKVLIHTQGDKTTQNPLEYYPDKESFTVAFTKGTYDEENDMLLYHTTDKEYRIVF